MSLIIFEANKAYHLHGNLTGSNSEKVYSYFFNEIQNKTQVILNLDNLNKVDIDGMITINALVELAKKASKSFKIIGWA
jgi:ABC-type transporter Mla MlaB component